MSDKLQRACTTIKKCWSSQCRPLSTDFFKFQQLMLNLAFIFNVANTVCLYVYLRVFAHVWVSNVGLIWRGSLQSTDVTRTFIVLPTFIFNKDCSLLRLASSDVYFIMLPLASPQTRHDKNSILVYKVTQNKAGRTVIGDYNDCYYLSNPRRQHYNPKLVRWRPPIDEHLVDVS